MKWYKATLIILLLFLINWTGGWKGSWLPHSKPEDGEEQTFCLHFNADSSDNMEVQHHPSLNIREAYTAFIRFQPDTGTAYDATYQVVIDKGGSYNLQGFHRNINKTLFYLTGISNWAATTPIDLFNDSCHTFSFIYDSAGDANNMGICYDGTTNISQTATGLINKVTDNLSIGKATGAYPYQGYICEVQIYARSLDSVERVWLDEHPYEVYNYDSLRLWLPLNESEGDTAFDYSTYGNDGIIDGAIWNMEVCE